MLLKGLAIVVFIVFILYIISVYALFHIGVKRQRTVKNTDLWLKTWGKSAPIIKKNIDDIMAQEPIQVHIESFDGLELNAYVLEAPQKSTKVFIAMHGFRNQNFADISGWSIMMHQQGYNVIMPDQRAHGESEGKYTCYGTKEKYDCRQWIDFAIKRYGDDCEIILGGVSMGCSTILMTLGFDDLPPQIKGCIADCGFTSPHDIFTYLFKNSIHLPLAVFNGFSWYTERKKILNLNASSTIEVLKKTDIPILFVHGTCDKLVPIEMTKINYEVCHSRKELLIIEGAPHASSYIYNPELCKQKALSFFGIV